MRRWLVHFFTVPLAIIALRQTATWALQGGSAADPGRGVVAALERDRQTALAAEAKARSCASELRTLAPAAVERGIAAGIGQGLQTDGVRRASGREKLEVQIAAANAIAQEVARLAAQATTGGVRGSGDVATAVADLGRRAQLVAEGICAARNVAQAVAAKAPPQRVRTVPAGRTRPAARE